MKITIKELRKMIKESINEQLGFDPWAPVRNWFVGNKTVYLQVNNLPNNRSAPASVIPLIQQGLMEQREELVAQVLNVVATTIMRDAIPGSVTNFISRKVMEILTNSTIQWGGSGDNPYGVVVVTLRGGENISEQWLENFRRRSETLLKTNISPNINLRLTQIR